MLLQGAVLTVLVSLFLFTLLVGLGLAWESGREWLPYLIREWPASSVGRPSAPVRIGGITMLLGVLSLIAWHVVRKTTQLHLDTPTAVYTVVISSYVLSRFVLAAFYRSPKHAGLEPACAVIVPAYNEGEAVARTIHALMALDYPADKLEVVVVNDGSTDDTWGHMSLAAGTYPDLRLGPCHDSCGADCPPGQCDYCDWRFHDAPRSRIRCIDLGSNQGKRAAMAAGIRATSAEILVFVDSDSVPARCGVRRLVQGFANPRVGAISGLTYVRNATANMLTRMQAARYYVSFQLLKAAESTLGAVACCSGCFAAYRRSAVVGLLDRWEHQRFLGVECTYGDDRALTNMVLRSGWVTRYDARAEAWTDAPDRYRKFFKQQLRWKKSWAREGPILLSHVWRTRTRAWRRPCPSGTPEWRLTLRAARHSSAACSAGRSARSRSPSAPRTTPPTIPPSPSRSTGCCDAPAFGWPSPARP
jgi:hyaluronan synthase